MAEGLAKQLLAGSEDAIQEFNLTYRPVVRRILHQLGLTPTEANDLAYDLLVDTVLKVHQYDPDRAIFGAWVRTTLQHAAIAYVRRRPKATFVTNGNLDAIAADPEILGEESYEHLVSAISGTVKDLSPETLPVFKILLDSPGKHPTEISRELNITVRTVYRQRQQLLNIARGVLNLHPSRARDSKDNSERKQQPTTPALDLLLTEFGGELKILAGQPIGLYKIVPPESLESQLLIASPYVICDITRSFLSKEIEEFEYLINRPHASERELQKFLERNSKFLLGQQYERAFPQLILEREQEGPLIPDFVLQPVDRSLCDIIDLKLPTDSVIIGGHNREGFSAAIHRAAAQLRRYRDYFDDSRHRDAVMKRYSLKLFRPRLAVIIGRRPACDDLLYRQIESGVPDVDIITYDDLITRAKRFRLC